MLPENDGTIHSVSFPLLLIEIKRVSQKHCSHGTHFVHVYVCTHLHKLVLKVLEAVEADRGHVPVLHRDGALGLLVLSKEREILKRYQMSLFQFQ